MSDRQNPIVILLADDDEEDRMLACDALIESRLSIDTFCVTDGEDLMDYLKRRGKYAPPAKAPRPGLILLDLNMPKKDGRAALREIKADPSLRQIPVVVLTTPATAEIRRREVLRLKLELWTKASKSVEGSSEVVEPPGTRGSVIDLAHLATLGEIQPGFLTELIDLFLTEASLDLKALQEAVAEHEAVEIKRMAHRLRGSSGSIGAIEMAAISERLERRAPTTDARELLVQLENEFGLVSSALNAERKVTEELGRQD